MMILIKRIYYSFLRKCLNKKLSRETNSIISSKCILTKSTHLSGFNIIGEVDISDTTIGRHTYIRSGNLSHCRIGNYCSIGKDVVVVSSMHPTKYVSTHPAFYNSQSNLLYRFDTKVDFEEKLLTNDGIACDIENDVWIGDHVLIKGGIKIHTGAIVGMGSVVTKDVPPYAIVAGNPAKIIRLRFDETTIAKLLSTEWWNMTEEALSNYASDFFDATFLFGTFTMRKITYDIV